MNDNFCIQTTYALPKNNLREPSQKFDIMKNSHPQTYGGRGAVGSALC